MAPNRKIFALKRIRLQARGCSGCCGLLRAAALLVGAPAVRGWRSKPSQGRAWHSAAKKRANLCRCFFLSSCFPKGITLCVRLAGFVLFDVRSLMCVSMQGRDAEAASGFLDEIRLLNSLAGRSNIIQLIDSEVGGSVGACMSCPACRLPAFLPRYECACMVCPALLFVCLLCASCLKQLAPTNAATQSYVPPALHACKPLVAALSPAAGAP
jgi:hypothetical protein